MILVFILSILSMAMGLMYTFANLAGSQSDWSWWLIGGLIGIPVAILAVMFREMLDRLMVMVVLAVVSAALGVMLTVINLLSENTPYSWWLVVCLVFVLPVVILSLATSIGMPDPYSRSRSSAGQTYRGSDSGHGTDTAAGEPDPEYDSSSTVNGLSCIGVTRLRMSVVMGMVVVAVVLVAAVSFWFYDKPLVLMAGWLFLSFILALLIIRVRQFKQVSAGTPLVALIAGGILSVSVYNLIEPESSRKENLFTGIKAKSGMTGHGRIANRRSQARSDKR